MDKKHLFEIVGTVFVVGALFLAFPTPTDSAAAGALNYVKLAWLAIIMAGLTVLVYQVFMLALRIEDVIVGKKVDFFGTFGLATALLGLALLYAIGDFAWLQYQGEIVGLARNPLTYVAVFVVLLRLRITLLTLMRSQVKERPRKLLLWLVITVAVTYVQVAPLLLLVQKYQKAVVAALTGMLTLFYLLTDALERIFKLKRETARILAAIAMLAAFIVTGYMLGVRVSSPNPTH